MKPQAPTYEQFSKLVKERYDFFVGLPKIQDRVDAYFYGEEGQEVLLRFYNRYLKQYANKEISFSQFNDYCVGTAAYNLMMMAEW